MRRTLLAAVAFAAAGCGSSSQAQFVSPSTVMASNAEHRAPRSHVRGWDFLVERLEHAGVPSEDVRRVYSDPRMPYFSEIPFSVAPKETKQMYAGFGSATDYADARSFLSRHAGELEYVERLLGVDREVIVAIMLVETHLGRYTGREMILNRLSRVASVREPKNMLINLKRLNRDDPRITLAQVESRAHYLEETFLPELVALFRIVRESQLDIFEIKGSIAGAFGLPQFLPSAYLRYGYDGSGDGKVSLFDETDALWSVGQYLASSGWRPDSTHEEKRAVIWKYNHSDPYIDTVLRIASRLREPEQSRSVVTASGKSSTAKTKTKNHSKRSGKTGKS